jgi:hypothetical protein
VFHLPSEEACVQLGIGANCDRPPAPRRPAPRLRPTDPPRPALPAGLTILKRLCRKFGIARCAPPPPPPNRLHFSSSELLRPLLTLHPAQPSLLAQVALPPRPPRHQEPPRPRARARPPAARRPPRAAGAAPPGRVRAAAALRE